mmetsp:Transcript_62064/g.147904  ORF Transcript_62064/g.147904 Transcript_62064/m.147904 type:complete len:203 (+) Transcript_62064:388-996(+)
MSWTSDLKSSAMGASASTAFLLSLANRTPITSMLVPLLLCTVTRVAWRSKSATERCSRGRPKDRKPSKAQQSRQKAARSRTSGPVSLVGAVDSPWKSRQTWIILASSLASNSKSSPSCADSLDPAREDLRVADSFSTSTFLSSLCRISFIRVSPGFGIGAKTAASQCSLRTCIRACFDSKSSLASPMRCATYSLSPCNADCW